MFAGSTGLLPFAEPAQVAKQLLQNRDFTTGGRRHTVCRDDRFAVLKVIFAEDFDAVGRIKTDQDNLCSTVSGSKKATVSVTLEM